MNMSTPELTIFDLVFFNKTCGGLSQSLDLIDDLCEQVQSDSLAEMSTGYQPIACLQRVGYLLDKVLA